MRQVHYYYPFGIHIYRPTKGNERDVPSRCIACSSTSAMLYASLAAPCIAVRTPLLRQTSALPRVADATVVIVAFIHDQCIPSRFHFEFQRDADAAVRRTAVVAPGCDSSVFPAAVVVLAAVIPYVKNITLLCAATNSSCLCCLVHCCISARNGGRVNYTVLFITFPGTHTSHSTTAVASTA